MKTGEICWPDIYMHGECCKVQEKTLWKTFLTSPSTPRSAWTPTKSKGSPLMGKNWENCPIVDFYSSKEAF